MSGTQRPARPFLYNFFAAFRAHHAFRPAATSSSASASASGAVAFAQQQQQQSSASQTQTQTSSYSTSSSPRPISHKPTLSPTGGVSAAFSPPSTHTHSAHRSPPVAGASPGFGPAPAPRTGRRGSDASSDSGGFRERSGTDAWFVGGRTATGEERFYRLGMVKRERSGERASVDRMSL